MAGNIQILRAIAPDVRNPSDTVFLALSNY